MAGETQSQGQGSGTQAGNAGGTQPPAGAAGGQAPENKGGTQPAGQPGAGEGFLGGDAKDKGQPGGEKPKDGQAPTGEKPKDGEAPKLELKLPEGINAKDPAVAEFTKLATESKLAPEVAQKLFDMHAAVLKSQEAEVQKELQAIQTQRAAWRAEIEKDPVLGGANLKASQETARRAIEKFGSPELTKLLKDEGLINHPALARFVHSVGKAMGEDTSAGSQNGLGRPARTADGSPPPGFYPSMER